MHRFLTLTLVICLAGAAAAQSVDLLRPWGAWSAGVDRAGSQMTLIPARAAGLFTTVQTDGTAEDYPKLSRDWPAPQNWTRFTRLSARVRVMCQDSSVREKPLTFVFYDEKTRREDLADHPMTQQGEAFTVPVGRWVDLRVWLVAIHRDTIRGLQLYLYSQPPARAHTYRWEVARLQLEGVGETATLFDTEIYSRQSLQATPTEAVASVASQDGLQLSVDKRGGVAGVALDGARVGGAWSQASGLLVRDVTREEPPVMVGGKVAAAAGAIHQSARLGRLGLSVEATYQSAGQWLEVKGKVADLQGRDRAVTVYFALPLSRGDWRWWDNAAASRTVSAQLADEASFVRPPELSYLEPGMDYGLNGMHSKYPLGAVTLPGRAGLTLGVRMDEPVVYRIGCNPALRLLYVAMDFGLVKSTTVDGRSLSEAPFRVLIYRHDPAWGFRSALQRYYDFFPQFFTNRIREHGGWFVWGDMSQTDHALDAGFLCHWGPSGPDAVKWDNAHKTLALLYIEAEFYQQTMGDYNRAPTVEECLDRARRLAAGNPEELAKFMKLGYSHYLPGSWEKAHSHQEACLAVNRAAASSVEFDGDQRPYGMIGQFPWIGDSRWGCIFPCNLDPDIPGGKGRFGKDLYLESGLKEMQEAGAHFDGIGLDSLGGYGQLSRANFRREHFKYTDVPLSFSARDHQPVAVAAFSTVKWVRALAADMHSRGLVLMANCSWNITPAWLTFCAPYLDILGAEAPRFEDPEYARAIAYRKCCTDLPYDPRPEWEVARNQLSGIFPGHGNKIAVMMKYANTFRTLSRLGWEPITYARVAEVDGSRASPLARNEDRVRGLTRLRDGSEPATDESPVRIERYGRAPDAWFVVHNTSEQPVVAQVRLDTHALGLPRFKARLVPSGPRLRTIGPRLTLALQGKETAVVEVERP